MNSRQWPVGSMLYHRLTGTPAQLLAPQYETYLWVRFAGQPPQTVPVDDFRLEPEEYASEEYASYVASLTNRGIALP